VYTIHIPITIYDDNVTKQSDHYEDINEIISHDGSITTTKSTVINIKYFNCDYNLNYICWENKLLPAVSQLMEKLNLTLKLMKLNLTKFSDVLKKMISGKINSPLSPPY
jgi:hypothetical protein